MIKMASFSPSHRLTSSLLALTLLVSTSVFAINTNDQFKPLPALQAKDLAIIVNSADPLSRKIADYYQQKRHIPKENMIHIRFNPKLKVLPINLFKKIKRRVDQLTPAHIQAYALTWMLPYRVSCMSITTAFATGFKASFCAVGCQDTLRSPYYNSDSPTPFTTFQWRPTMLLAGETFDEVKQLIDRGVASDFSHPKGTAYLLKTADKERSVRSVFFPEISTNFDGILKTKTLWQDSIEGKHDVMFYFTGKKFVEKIATNTFLPGAVADHLTSLGGELSNGSQMSSLEWLKAGATGSYGTAIEPCNFVQKFPNPSVLMNYYIRGNSLIEAYWKSVAWPGQGIFIGEPLAKPFANKNTSSK